jgi:hypothetical protein
LTITRTQKLAAAVFAGAAVLGAGGAIAATKLLSPQERSQAIIDDAAKQLGVPSSKLSAALKKALENQVDAQVAAGTITKAEGDALKQRIEAGGVPLLGFGLGRLEFGHRGLGLGFGPLAGLDAAASYLGLTDAQLRDQLGAGKSLADVATAQGKSVDGLVAALVDAAKKKLDAAVAAGRITQAQADSIASGLKERITDRVNEPGPLFFGGPRLNGRRFFGGPPFFAPRRWRRA